MNDELRERLIAYCKRNDLFLFEQVSERKRKTYAVSRKDVIIAAGYAGYLLKILKHL